ncbi:unnamed protein product [Camellia sinensis]
MLYKGQVRLQEEHTTQAFIFLSSLLRVFALYCFENMAASKVTPGSMTQLIKGDRSMLMMSYDNVMMKQIQGTHNPDGRKIDVKPILHIVVDILSRATMPVETSIVLGMGVQGHMEHFEEKGQQGGVINMLEALSLIIRQLSSEASIQVSNWHGRPSNNNLSVHRAIKLFMGCQAGASTSSLRFELRSIPAPSSDVHIKPTRKINGTPEAITGHRGTLWPVKSRFDALNTLITAMLDLIRCIVALKDLPSSYVTQEVPALSAAIATIPTSVYWTVRGIVACATQITSLTSLTSLTSMGYEEEKRNLEAYVSLVRLMQMIHLDSMKVLRALIYAKDDLLPLFDGSAKRRVNLEVLRRKNVLLLISGLDISMDELSILEQIYNDSRHQGTRLDNLYEMVWIPVVDRSVQWTDPMQKFIREKWHFKNKAILVVLDPQGDDLEWIRRFTTRATAVARDARIPLEMVYVGKSSKRELVRRVIQTVNNDKMGIAWQEPMIWFFWTRLESMLFSKMQLGRVDDYDPMLQEIKKLLSYDKSGGWAVLCRGSEVVVNGHGTTVLPTLVEYEDIWKINVPTNGFDKSFKDHHDKLHGITHPCCRFEFPSVAGRIPESMKCPECLRVMDKHITFICCHDESATTNTNVLY